MVSISMGKGSKQDYQTPHEFIKAVEKKFGRIVLDLAASADNAQTERYYSIDQDSLQQDWLKLLGLLKSFKEYSVFWLNPPYADITPWVKKCADLDEHLVSGKPRLVVLLPASVGSNWFRKYVYGVADVYFFEWAPYFCRTNNALPKRLHASCLWTTLETQ